MALTSVLVGSPWSESAKHSWASRNSRRLVVDLFKQIINIIGGVVWAHGGNNILYGLRLRKVVKLLRAMDTRELKD